MKKIVFLATVCFFSISTIAYSTVKKKEKEHIAAKMPEHSFKLHCVDRVIKTSLRSYANMHLEKDQKQLKSALITEQKLDSSIVENWIDSTSTWIPDSKTEYNYNSQGNEALILMYSWNDTTGTWVNSDKEVFNYNDNAKPERLTVSWWNEEDQSWMDYAKIEISYNDDGSEKDGIYYFMNFSTLQLEPMMKYETFYGNESDIEIDYRWDAEIEQWVNDDKYEYYYDVNGNDTLENYYYWIDSTSQWTVDGKYEYNYDNNENKTLSAHFNWIDSTSQWVNMEKHEYSYDNNENKTLDTYSKWTDSTAQWTYTRKYEYTYDSNDNKTLETYLKWDTSTSQWVYYSKEDDYTYDAEGNITQYQTYDWDDDASLWIADNKYTNYYSAHEITKSPDIKSKIKITVCPNPAKDFIVFKGLQESTMEVDLYDISGRRILSKKLSHGTKLSTELLKPGIYTYKLTKASETYLGKIIIQ